MAPGAFVGDPELPNALNSGIALKPYRASCYGVRYIPYNN